jgi:hypothetical protein
MLTLIKTSKGILCGGFSSVSWKNSAGWTVDTKTFIYSLKLNKIYKRLNDNDNLLFNSGYGIWFGSGANLGITSDGKLFSYCDSDPFKVPKNSQGMHEITEEAHCSCIEFNDYEVFAISTE